MIAFRAHLDNSVQFPHLKTLILIISSKILFPYKLLQRLRFDIFKGNYFIFKGTLLVYSLFIMCQFQVYSRVCQLYMYTRVCMCVCMGVCTQSCLTLCDPVDCSQAPLSMEFQARILDWIAISLSTLFWILFPYSKNHFFKITLVHSAYLINCL